jgi:hypothetical protein
MLEAATDQDFLALQASCASFMNHAISDRLLRSQQL